MTWILVIYLAIGADYIEKGLTESQCFAKLERQRAHYSRTYVIKSSGCLPENIVRKMGS